jgi:hypothetical protein
MQGVCWEAGWDDAYGRTREMADSNIFELGAVRVCRCHLFCN